MHSPGAQTCQVCGANLPTPAGTPLSPVLVASDGKQYRLNATADTLIGSQGCAILLSDPGVAPQQARIRPSGREFVIESMGGKTRVNGAIIAASTVLKSGDVITVGKTHLVFRVPERPAGASMKQLAPQKKEKPLAQRQPAPTASPAGSPQVSVSSSLPSPSVEARLRGERTVWKGRPGFLLSPATWFTSRYKLTNERLLVTTGVLSRSLEEVELIRVKDIRLETGCLQRIFSVGTIVVLSVDRTAPELQLINVPRANRVREAIRSALRDERQKQGVRFAEFMT